MEKEKLGRKGNRLLEKLYFKDYPSLEHIENAIKDEPILALKVTLVITIITTFVPAKRFPCTLSRDKIVAG